MYIYLLFTIFTFVWLMTAASSSCVSLTRSGSGLATPRRTHVTHGTKLILESLPSPSSISLHKILMCFWPSYFCNTATTLFRLQGGGGCEVAVFGSYIFKLPKWRHKSKNDKTTRWGSSMLLVFLLHAGSHLTVTTLPHNSKENKTQRKYVNWFRPQNKHFRIEDDDFTDVFASWKRSPRCRCSPALRTWWSNSSQP